MRFWDREGNRRDGPAWVLLFAAMLYVVLPSVGCTSPAEALPAATVEPTDISRVAATEAATAAPASAEVRALMAQLNSEDAVERAEAAHELGLLGPSAAAATSLLIHLLDDDTPLFAQFGLATTSPAQEAAIALARLGQVEGVERLVSDLRSGDGPRRARALAGLAASRDAGLQALRQAAPLDELTALAIDPRVESRLRSQAIRLLGRLEDPSVIPTLGGLLQDPSAPVRTAAAAALGEIGDCRAVPWLLDAMARGDSAERFLLGAMLTQVTEQAFGNDLDAWRQWWEAQTCPP